MSHKDIESNMATKTNGGTFKSAPKKKVSKSKKMALEWADMKRLMPLCLTATLIGAVISIPAAFAPSVLGRQGASGSQIGALFAIPAVSVLLLAWPLVRFSQTVALRLRILLISLPILSFFTILFGLDETNFQYLFLARAGQGLAYASAQTTVFGVAADWFPNRKHKAIGAMEAAAGFGWMLGPALGGVLFMSGGWALPSVVLGVAVLLPVFAVYHGATPTELEDAAPNELLTLLGVSEEDPDSNDDSETEGEEDVGDGITVLDIVSNRHVIAALVPVFFVEFSASAMQPVLEPFIDNLAPGLSGGTVGFLVSLQFVAYTLVSPMVGALSARFGSRPVTLWGLASSAISYAALSQTQGYSSPLVFYSVTSLMVGVGTACAFVPSLPYMGRATKYLGSNVNGRLSAIWNFVMACGMTIGPVIGGWVAEISGFAFMTNMQAVLAVVSLVLFWALTRKPIP